MENKHNILGEFLKSRRERLNPAHVGISGGYGRRRTPGLRREEVAELSNVSTTWYTWLEQGRDVVASKEVMQSISRALLLSPDEQLHLMRLSGYGELPVAVSPVSGIEPGLQKLIDAIGYPTIIVNRRTEILAWNKQAPEFIYDFNADPEMGRVMTWAVFMNPYVRKHLVNWDDFAPYSAAIFRAYYDQCKGDPWYEDFAQKLSKESREFAVLWEKHDVQQKKTRPFILDHPHIGKLSFELNTFAHINGNEDLHCCIYTPMFDTDTEQKMKMYASRSN